MDAYTKAFGAVLLLGMVSLGLLITKANKDDSAPAAFQPIPGHVFPVVDPDDPWNDVPINTSATCETSPDRVVIVLHRAETDRWDSLAFMYGRGPSSTRRKDSTASVSEEASGREANQRKLLVWFWIQYWFAHAKQYRLVIVHNSGALSAEVIANLTTSCVSFYEYRSPAADPRDVDALRIPYVYQYVQWAKTTTDSAEQASLQGRGIRFLVHQDMEAVCFQTPIRAFARWPQSLDVVVSRLLKRDDLPVPPSVHLVVGKQLRRCIVNTLPSSLGGGPTHHKRWDSRRMHPSDLTSVAFAGHAQKLLPMFEQLDHVSHLIGSKRGCDTAMVTYGFQWFGYSHDGEQASRFRTHYAYTAPPVVPYCTAAPCALQRIPDVNHRNPAPKYIEHEFPCGHAVNVEATVESCFDKLVADGPMALSPFYTPSGTLMC